MQVETPGPVPKWSDQQIILNLREKQKYQGPFEEGSEGRCLFYSIVPQITQADVGRGLTSKFKKYFERWSALSKADKADRLRHMALDEEEDFLAALPINTKEFTPDQIQERIVELYKDGIQQFENVGAEALNRARTTSLQEQFAFCKNRFKEYKEATWRPSNWAGTSELIAIGRFILNRKIKLFWQEGSETHLDAQGNVLPYYSSSKRRASTSGISMPWRRPLSTFTASTYR